MNEDDLFEYNDETYKNNTEEVKIAFKITIRFNFFLLLLLKKAKNRNDDFNILGQDFITKIWKAY